MIKKISMLLVLLLAISAFEPRPAVGQEYPHAPTFKLPEYYVGHWTAAAIRSGDFSYFLRCDGTGEARWNHGKKEKFQDLFYRVLSVADDEVLLFVKEVETQESIVMMCSDNKGKKKKECVKNIGNPYYQYWLLSPSDSYGPEFKMMRIETYSWGYDTPPFLGITNPDAQSDQWLKEAYEKTQDWSTTSAYHFRSPLPCTDK